MHDYITAHTKKATLQEINLLSMALVLDRITAEMISLRFYGNDFPLPATATSEYAANEKLQHIYLICYS